MPASARYRSLNDGEGLVGNGDVVVRESRRDQTVDLVGDRLAGGETGRLDADEVDETWRAVAAGFFDHVVAERLAGALQLGRMPA